nr:MAG TPA: hypothetical protein [Caudoviricetes sp.]
MEIFPESKPVFSHTDLKSTILNSISPLVSINNAFISPVNSHLASLIRVTILLTP